MLSYYHHRALPEESAIGRGCVHPVRYSLFSAYTGSFQHREFLLRMTDVQGTAECSMAEHIISIRNDGRKLGDKIDTLAHQIIREVSSASGSKRYISSTLRERIFMILFPSSSIIFIFVFCSSAILSLISSRKKPVLPCPAGDRKAADKPLLRSRNVFP